MTAVAKTKSPPPIDASFVLDEIDQAIIRASQKGLAIEPRPYHVLAQKVGISPVEAMMRLKRMMDSGIIRRIAAVPNHYALGYISNGMSVWDVHDDRISVLGRKVGELPFVSHCYHRPRQLPDWPYNLFAMVHGRDRTDVIRHVAEIKTLLGNDANGNDVLYSTKILKKTGLRISM